MMVDGNIVKIKDFKTSEKGEKKNYPAHRI
jgi:hypothetical protein